MTPIDKLNRTGESLGHLSPRQWENCKLEKYHLSQGRAHRLDIQNQIVSPEIIHTSHIDKAGCIYLCTYIDTYTNTIKF